MLLDLIDVQCHGLAFFVFTFVFLKLYYIFYYMPCTLCNEIVILVDYERSCESLFTSKTAVSNLIPGRVGIFNFSLGLEIGGMVGVETQSLVSVPSYGVLIAICHRIGWPL